MKIDIYGFVVKIFGDNRYRKYFTQVPGISNVSVLMNTPFKIFGLRTKGSHKC